MWYLVYSHAVGKFYVLSKESLMDKRSILQLEVVRASNDYLELSDACATTMYLNLCLN